jgi:hypothetical protein
MCVDVVFAHTERPLWGVYTGYDHASLTSFEEVVGSEADIKAVFVPWYGAFPSDAVDQSFASSSKTLLVFWEQIDWNPVTGERIDITLDDIIGGAYDEVITRFASSAQAYGGKVILAPFHEMNGDWVPWGGFPTHNPYHNTPDKLIEAWRHVHTVFRQTETPNVQFGFAVNHTSWPNIPENDIEHYYPGHDYVDIVGVDGFSWGTDNNPWADFDTIFKPALTKLAEYNKPLFIFSFAAADREEKASWITEALTTKMSQYRIAGWVWFNEHKEQNWLVTSRPDALEAFRSAIFGYASSSLSGENEGGATTTPRDETGSSTVEILIGGDEGMVDGEFVVSTSTEPTRDTREEGDAGSPNMTPTSDTGTSSDTTVEIYVPTPGSGTTTETAIDQDPTPVPGESGEMSATTPTVDTEVVPGTLQRNEDSSEVPSTNAISHSTPETATVEILVSTETHAEPVFEAPSTQNEMEEVVATPAQSLVNDTTNPTL